VDITYTLKEGRVHASDVDLTYSLKEGRVHASDVDLTYTEKEGRVHAADVDITLDEKEGRVHASDVEVTYTYPAEAVVTAADVVVTDPSGGAIEVGDLIKGAQHVDPAETPPTTPGGKPGYDPQG
jgi:hypothetical protein